MDVEKALLQVKQLLAKSISTHSNEEARTCAFIAARKIAEYGLKIVIEEPCASNTLSSTIDEDLLRRTWENFNKKSKQEKQEDCTWIKTKFGGMCISCKKRLEIGERVLWFPQKGCNCEKCAKERARNDI